MDKEISCSGPKTQMFSRAAAGRKAEKGAAQEPMALRSEGQAYMSQPPHERRPSRP